MKRGGKDEEKILEPMFPRLHVNDADKGGGPRAPPRNKMALYEQLSIPSQRFSGGDHGTLSRMEKTTSLLHHLPLGSSSQPYSVEKNSHAKNLDSSSAVHSTDNFVSQVSMENVRSLGQHDQRKPVREDEDFAVPVFVNSRKSQLHGKPKSGSEMGTHTTLSRDQVKSLDASATARIDLEASSCDRVNDCNPSSRQDSRSRLDRSGGETRVTETDIGVESPLVAESHLEEASDDVSDNSMVDSISSVDISPDDVVGVLGQKRFWRARKAIANQQRVFAVQLFELHRLIKVQRLIAASPDLLLDDLTFLGKISAKSYPVKKLLPSEFMVKPPIPRVVVKPRVVDSENLEQHKMECSAENVIGRSPNQGHHHHQPSNYMPPFASNQDASQNVNGCCFPPPQPPPPPSGGNQQWLIPVMSPSEGLIYKPHPGPGHTGPVYGGGYYGHFMPPPIVMGGFMGGGGPHPYHPGVGFPSHGNGYFPPYGMMPMANPYYSNPQQQQQQQQPYEQMYQPVHPGNHQNASANEQSSVNEAAAVEPTKSHPRAKKSRQGSTGSCPNRSEGISGKKSSFQPLSAVDGGEENNSNETEKNTPEQTTTTTTTTTRTTVTQTTRDGGGGVTRVIKVVPHNAKLASENAARIFRSIQEERKNYDSFSSHP